MTPSIDNALASLAVRDITQAASWYEAVLGRPADARPMPNLAEWRFPRGGGLQVYELPERAGQGSATLAVSDLAAQIAALDRLGIDTGTCTSSPQVKTVMVTDPDGNHLAFAEALDGSVSR